MKFLITGCGRSGTGYVSALLNALSILTAHERVFLPYERRPWGDYAGDVSWFGVPFLHEVVTEEVTIVHLVREPIACGRSYAGLRFFHGDREAMEHAHYSGAVWRYDTGPFDWPDPHDRFAAFWLRWNLAVEPHAHARVRSEDLLERDGVMRLLRVIGHERAAQDVDAAISAMDPGTHGGERDMSLCWDSVSPTLRALVRKMAERYGYFPDTQSGPSSVSTT